jgi:hypothetical protein
MPDRSFFQAAEFRQEKFFEGEMDAKRGLIPEDRQTIRDLSYEQLKCERIKTKPVIS